MMFGTFLTFFVFLWLLAFEFDFFLFGLLDGVGYLRRFPQTPFSSLIFVVFYVRSGEVITLKTPEYPADGQRGQTHQEQGRGYAARMPARETMCTEQDAFLLALPRTVRENHRPRHKGILQALR